MRFHAFWRYRRILFTRRFARVVWRSRRNVAAARLGHPPVCGPYMAELDITYRCNCHCRMCQRWQDSRDGELALEEYVELAAALERLGVHQVTVAGGEPLMRPDAFDIIGAFASRGLSVNICSNGILLGKYAAQICRSGATCLTVSLDGAAPGCHDSIRATPGAYHRTVEGLRAIMAIPAGRRPLVRVRMTVSDANVQQVRQFYLQWKDRVDDVLLQPMHRCGDAYYTGDLVWGIDPGELARQLSGLPLGKDGYMAELVHSLETSGTFPRHRCYAGVLMVRIDPWGKVYPCLEQHLCLGSIRTERFDVIWNSRAFNRARNRVANDSQCHCWYNNTALISHYARLLERTLAPRRRQASGRPSSGH